MFGKLFTLFRATAHEAEQVAIDANALSILEQELRDAAAALNASNRELTALIAREIAERRAVDAAGATIEKHEAQALKALDKGEEAIAAELAERIAEAERRRDAARAAVEGYRAQIGRLRKAIGETDRRIAQMQRELARARSTAALHRAELAVQHSAHAGCSALAAAEDSLERIRALQQERADRLTAAALLAEERDGRTLDEAMRRAGIADDEGPSAASVLERLKGRAKSGGSKDSGNGGGESQGA